MGSPISSQGSQAAAASRLPQKTVAWSVTAATSGMPTAVMLMPKRLVVSPIHSSRKSRWPRSPLRGGGSWSMPGARSDSPALMTSPP